MAGADHGKEHLSTKEDGHEKQRTTGGKRRPWSITIITVKNLFINCQHYRVTVEKTERVHGRGAFSSPKSCWRSTSLSVRGCARMGVPSVAPG